MGFEPTTTEFRNQPIHMVFFTDTFSEVAIGSWLDWDLNPRPLNSIQTL